MDMTFNKQTSTVRPLRHRHGMLMVLVDVGNLDAMGCEVRKVFLSNAM